MKKHLSWYNLVFLEHLDKDEWDTTDYSLDLISWDIPIYSLGQTSWYTPEEDLDQIKLDTPVEDLDLIGLDTPFEDQEKDIQTKDTDSEDTDTEDADSEDADSEDAESEDADSEDADSEDAESEDTDAEDTDTEDADTEDADTEDADSKDADSKDANLLSFYFKDLKEHGRLLDHEQEFWLALDIQAGLRMSQAISSDGIAGVYGDLRDNWDQYSAMIESLRLPSIDWNEAVSVMAHQRLNKERVRFTEMFTWLESANDRTEVGQKISWYATRIYLDLIILPVAALLMIAGHFAKDDFALPDGNEINHWFTADPTIDWPVDEIYTQANQARERLILSNWRLVIKIAKRYRGRGEEFEDLIQQGNLGLILTIDGYDPSKGYKFSTYAVFRIRKEITRYIIDNSRLIRLPDDVSEKRYLVHQARERLDQQLHRLPTAGEIAEALDLTTAAEVATILKFARKLKSTDEPVGESVDDVLGDFIEDPDQTDRLNVIEQHQLAKDIQDVLNMLPANQREVISLRFGFDGKPRTFKEVGDTLGVPEEQIRKIEDAAFSYLRHPARSKLLREYLDLLLLLLS
jgi:RNA polymerase primary sigma factor